MSMSFRGIEGLCQALAMRPLQMEIPLERHLGEECLQGGEGHPEEAPQEVEWDAVPLQDSWLKCPNSRHPQCQSHQ